MLTWLKHSFLKLCKVKYYNFSPVHSVQKSFSFQTGDPLGPISPKSDGGSSIWGLLSGDPSQRTFPALFHPKLKHVERGTVGMATVPHSSDPDVRLVASQFIVTLGDNTDYLDGKSAIFGHVVEGFDVLEKINDAIVDDTGYPLADIRIKHTAVLDDPYPDPAGLVEPPASPPPSRAQLDTVRLGEDDQRKIVENEEDTEEKAAELEKMRREREARAQALTLEMMGDLPFAEVKPPENVLFVCKLNPVTQDSDLELIFSRFGKILSCEVVRDHKTGDSLQYAFIEFEDKGACEAAYFKMQDVLIDDRRIHVDFSQSVSKLSDVWRNETNTKRRKQARGRGGWGGVRELEKWRKYRNEDDDDEPAYDMVHGEDELKGQHDKLLAGKGHNARADDHGEEEVQRGGFGSGSRDRLREFTPYGDNGQEGYKDWNSGEDRFKSIDGHKDRLGHRDRSRDRGRGGPDDRNRNRSKSGGKYKESRRDRSLDRYRDGRTRGYDSFRESRPRSNARSRSPRRETHRSGQGDRWR